MSRNLIAEQARREARRQETRRHLASMFRIACIAVVLLIVAAWAASEYLTGGL